MKRLLILGVALASMGEVAQCPKSFVPQEPQECGDLAVVTPPGTCFELLLNPCSGRPWEYLEYVYVASDGVSSRQDLAEHVSRQFICADTTLTTPVRTQYLVELSGSDGPPIGTGLVTVTAKAPIAVAASATPTDILMGQSSQLTGTASGGTPPYHYFWEPAGSLSDPSTASPLATPTVTTTYTLRVVDDQNRAGIATVTVVFVPPLTVAPTVTYSNGRPGDPVILEAHPHGGDGHYSYLWSPADAVDTPHSESTMASPMASMTYTITVADGHGQAATAAIPVTVAAPLAASFVSRQPGTALPFDVTLDASASTGAIVSYEWDLSWIAGAPDFITTGPIATFTRTQESLRGTITLTVRDASGNTATVSRPYP
jgi:hypothetical protein